jgi:hypothetical protein
MGINRAVSRLKPQLVRKRTVIQLPKTVKVVIQPSKAKVASLQQVKQVQQVQIRSDRARIRTQPQPPRPPANAAVSQKSVRKALRRKTQVKYISASVTRESISRVNAMRRVGTGKVLLIIGNGPSISEVELQRLRGVAGIDTLSVNKPDERLWPTTHWCFFDGSQMRRHEELWTNYNGNIFNSTAIKKQKASSMQIKNLHGRGFSRDLSKGIHIGRSSVFAAMQIGLWMDYNQIYIFGCDMNPEGLNGKLHFYGDNPDVEPGIRKKRFEEEANHYSHAATILSQGERDKFTFCTEYNPWSFVKEFQQMSHKDAVDNILQHSQRL